MPDIGKAVPQPPGEHGLCPHHLHGKVQIYHVDGEAHKAAMNAAAVAQEQTLALGQERLSHQAQKAGQEVVCHGDVEVDDHHSVEDIGIVLGQAFREALGVKAGITRYGDTVLPMDEALIASAVDFSGRCYLGYGLRIPTEKVGSFDTELTEEFFAAFVRKAECALHVRQLAGSNSHHIIEGTFKSVARSLKEAVAIDVRFADEIPSTKGVL